MDFSFTPEQERFRQEIRSFLRETLTPDFLASIPEEREGFSREFSKRLGERGLIGLPWPKEYGGKELGYIERLIYDEEMVLHQAPRAYHHTAERQMGPSIIMFGTPEQKRTFLPAIARGELGFCIGYSEPESGSDLASLSCRAVLDGDDFVVNGTKIWTSQAHLQDYVWLAVRTNPDVPKHKGISILIVDLKSPGITIQPILNMLGIHSFNQVFFDNVRVPKANLVGEKDMGWYVAASNLDFERAGMERVYLFFPLFKELVRFVKEAKVNGRTLWEDPMVRSKLAEMAIEFEVGKLLSYKVAWSLSQGQVPNKESAMAKFYGASVQQRFAHGATQILGLYGALERGSKWAPLAGKVERAYITSLSLSIAGGTSEIMRNIVALRGLGLPRG